MTTLLIIGAVLACCGLLFGTAEYLVRRIERIGMPLRRLEVERTDGTVEVYHPAYPLPDDAEAYEAPIGPAAGCLVGLAMAAVMWAAIIGAAWGIWTVIAR
ncbi:MAG TPA: hypothetical protein VF188_00385 [Longimicrobiales bacterium]